MIFSKLTQKSVVTSDFKKSRSICAKPQIHRTKQKHWLFVIVKQLTTLSLLIIASVANATRGNLLRYFDVRNPKSKIKA